MFYRNSARGCDCHGQQWTKGRFLLLFSIPSKTGIGSIGLAGCARSVKLTQTGHFMMGHTSLSGGLITLSGPYGGDSLPRDIDALPQLVRDSLVRLPDELYQAWNNDADHLIQQWAVKNEKALAKAGRVKWPAVTATSYADHSAVFTIYFDCEKAGDTYPQNSVFGGLRQYTSRETGMPSTKKWWAAVGYVGWRLTSRVLMGKRDLQTDHEEVRYRCGGEVRTGTILSLGTDFNQRLVILPPGKGPREPDMVGWDDILD